MTDDSEETEDEGRTLLTEEWYNKILSGIDLRGAIREHHAEGMDERGVRCAAGIMIVMFKKYPLRFTLEEVTHAINLERFDVMEDGAFREYVKEVIQAMKN